MNLKFKISSIIIIFTIINLSSLQADEDYSFVEWLENIKNIATKEGISQETVDSSLRDIAINERVLELDRSQPEFTLTLDEYLNNTTPKSRMLKGKKLYSEHKDLLLRIYNKYGVQPRFILALWGIETSFGTYTGSFNVIRSLSTLSHDIRRREFFTDELINALTIIDQGHITSDEMMGSWAGAMGQNQFMPSSFLNYATDFDKDSKKDIWSTLPDVFASSSNYLKESGWNDDLTWGREVMTSKSIPDDLITTSAKEINISKPLSEWADYCALKPGGIFGVVEHRAKPGTSLEDMRKSGYVTEELTINLAKEVGFALSDRSNINNNINISSSRSRRMSRRRSRGSSRHRHRSSSRRSWWRCVCCRGSCCWRRCCGLAWWRCCC